MYVCICNVVYEYASIHTRIVCLCVCVFVLVCVDACASKTASTPDPPTSGREKRAAIVYMKVDYNLRMHQMEADFGFR